MMAALIKTRTPGIYKRGPRYVVVWLHRGRQHKRAFRTYELAREFKGRANAQGERPTSAQTVAEYAELWIESYAGRTVKGIEETTRADYRFSIEHRILPYLGRMKLRDIGPPDVTAWYRWLEAEGETERSIGKANQTRISFGWPSPRRPPARSG